MVKKEKYLEGGTKILQKKFIYIEILGKRYIFDQIANF